MQRRAKPLAEPTDGQAAELYAVTLLARRDFAPGELAARLTARGFAAATVQRLIAALAAAGTLNPARYAQNYVTRHVARGQGPLRIAAALRQRGVEPELIEQALAEHDWPQLARTVAGRRFGAGEPVSWRERAQRARFLQYRGFSADHIRLATGADPSAD